MSHSNDVDDAVRKMLELGLAGEQQPPSPAPPQEPGQPPVPPAETGETTTPPVPPQRPHTPRAKTPKAPKPKNASSPEPLPEPGGLKKRVAVLMDRDLIALMDLAQPALGGMTAAQIFTAAARQYRAVAAELPGSPLVTTVMDDLYDEVVTESAHRTVLGPYMTDRGRAVLDADAVLCGLDRSEFVRRVVRAFLTIDKVFVPVSKRHLLTETYIDAVLEELKVQMAAGHPAAVLPSATGQQWAMERLPKGTPLRGLADEARQTMPGCLSATQALLTVL